MNDDQRVEEIRDYALKESIGGYWEERTPQKIWSDIRFLLSRLGVVMVAIEESCENDNDIRDLARPILGDLKTDGDSNAVPTTACIVEELIKHYKDKDNPNG